MDKCFGCKNLGHYEQFVVVVDILYTANKSRVPKFQKIVFKSFFRFLVGRKTAECFDLKT